LDDSLTHDVARSVPLILPDFDAFDEFGLAMGYEQTYGSEAASTNRRRIMAG
jgi:hypothetical protein